MTPTEAEALAGRLLAAIDKERAADAVGYCWAHNDTDRERVASDIAGLREHRPDSRFDGYCHSCGDILPCLDAARYADGLRRTAALYEVAP